MVNFSFTQKKKYKDFYFNVMENNIKPSTVPEKKLSAIEFFFNSTLFKLLPGKKKG